MDRKFRIALAAAVAASWSISGCGDSGSTSTAERSAEAIKTDAKGQDAMKEFMQGKGGKSKAH
ncbi:hypothetical protein [Paludisphaera mucosa]|uniref:Uncharacterized protein n=1 Tax=Paludisphaera mucosa TaxID=3030827 RepID=A0ABT6F4M0_9BACT|nr:hypothetical protein [Paludisphaera mucosa]MDG3002350.1 hypothetical protein [Paludisphaera mucosa]